MDVYIVDIYWSVSSRFKLFTEYSYMKRVCCVLSRQLLNCVAADRPTDFDIQPDGATPTRLVTSFHEKPFTNIKKKNSYKTNIKANGYTFYERFTKDFLS